ncbi:winged helix-turn-helix domain-containing protein [Streptomyces sp. NPDC048290]|uniref:winged helix-turn-helix domain-containing protein n=1 Tax=Streptomyces sp. NPDC048290 TaxID=3155811 RepID=UPI00341B718A
MRGRWKGGGERGGKGGIGVLASKGPAELSGLPDAQFTVLEREPVLGPAGHGWEGQRWTVVRIREVIARTFGIACSAAGVWWLVYRGGVSCAGVLAGCARRPCGAGRRARGFLCVRPGRVCGMRSRVCFTRPCPAPPCPGRLCRGPLFSGLLCPG